MYRVLRIRLAAAMIRLTRAGADAGAIALPLTSRAFLTGLQSLEVSESPPALPGLQDASATEVEAKVKMRATRAVMPSRKLRTTCRSDSGAVRSGLMPISFVSLRG